MPNRIHLHVLDYRGGSLGASRVEIHASSQAKEYPGADDVADWYGSNLHIFANLMRLITSPDDRVLVIYSQGHAKLLRSFIKDSPDLEFVDPLSFLK